MFRHVQISIIQNCNNQIALLFRPCCHGCRLPLMWALLALVFVAHTAMRNKIIVVFLSFRFSLNQSRSRYVSPSSEFFKFEIAMIKPPHYFDAYSDEKESRGILVSLYFFNFFLFLFWTVLMSNLASPCSCSNAKSVRSLTQSMLFTILETYHPNVSFKLDGYCSFIFYCSWRVYSRSKIVWCEWRFSRGIARQQRKENESCSLISLSHLFKKCTLVV